MPTRRDVPEGRTAERARRDDATFDESQKKLKRRPRPLSAAAAGDAGLRHITDLTTSEALGVTLVQPHDDGWQVQVEVVEDRRIPSSGDILALYETELDAEGNLLSYRRVRRYRRGSSDIGGAS